MKQITLSILLLLPTICFSQKQKKQIMVSEDSIINKWQKAVIDIASESDKLNIYPLLQFISSRKQQNKSYSLIDSLKDYDSLRSLINRTSGTAIYLADGKNRYLITAKHVVFDRNFTIRHKYFTQENLSKRSDEYFEKFNANVTIETPLSLFLKGKYNSFELPEINQDSVTRPFKFSDNNLDIAILSLQSQKTYLIQKVLEEDGYSPIDIKNIDTIDNNKIGDNLIAIGYPSYSLL